MASGLKGKVVHVKIVVLHLFPTEIAAKATDFGNNLCCRIKEIQSSETFLWNQVI